MNRRDRREVIIGAVIAFAAFVAIIASKPLSWGTGVCSILVAFGLFPAVANALALARGDGPTFPIFSDESMTRPVGRARSVIGPLSFAAFTFLIWLGA
jgi:hypothetical protein